VSRHRPTVFGQPAFWAIALSAFACLWLASLLHLI
jgi:hypothetical protein